MSKNLKEQSEQQDKSYQGWLAAGCPTSVTVIVACFLLTDIEGCLIVSPSESVAMVSSVTLPTDTVPTARRRHRGEPRLKARHSGQQTMAARNLRNFFGRVRDGSDRRKGAEAYS